MSGWPEVTLGELCHIARGGSPRPIKSFLTSNADGINWVKIGDATAGDGKFIATTQEKIKPEGAKMSRLVEPGDFLLSNSMSFGRPYIMQTTGCIHDGWLVLRDKSNRIDPEYLYYFLGSDAAYRQFDALAAGSTVRNLNTDLVKSVKVILPPVQEQRRIVAVLDEAFTAIATATANTEKNVANVRRLFRFALDEEFSRDFPQIAMKDLCSFENGDRGENYAGRSAFVDKGIPIINAGHLDDGKIDMATMNFISRERFDLLRSGKVRRGDVLFCLRGSLGKFAYNDAYDEGAIASSLIIIRPGQRILPAYLCEYLRSSICSSMIRYHENGAAQPNLGGKSLEKFLVPTPNLATQRAIVDRLHATRVAMQEMETVYQRKLSELAGLKHSLLDRAFRGQLIDNEPRAA